MKRMISLACAACLVLCAFAGCSSGSASQSSQSTEPSSSEEALTVKVTAISENTITAVIGELAFGWAPSGALPDAMPSADAAETPPAMPSGDAAETPPAMPSADAAGTPPAMPSGDGSAPSGGRPQNGDSAFRETGETITFTLTDSTIVAKGTDEASLEDITVGSILEITLNTDQTAKTIIIPALRSDKNNGESAANGTSANTITNS